MESVRVVVLLVPPLSGTPLIFVHSLLSEQFFQKKNRPARFAARGDTVGANFLWWFRIRDHWGRLGAIWPSLPFLGLSHVFFMIIKTFLTHTTWQGDCPLAGSASMHTQGPELQ